MLTKCCLVAIVIFAWLPVSALATVSVQKSTPTIGYKTFDPDKPPQHMPHLTPPEAAVTVCGFGFSAEPRYEVVSRERTADGKWTATIVCNGVTVSVRLSVVIWTPKGVSAKLKAHEEGHRKLDEMIYKKLAETAGRAAGAEMDGHRFTGEGTTAANAVSNAVRNMFQQAGHDFMTQTAGVNEEINATYDAITQHGTNDIPEAEAIKQALERYEHDHPANAPAAAAPVEKK